MKNRNGILLEIKVKDSPNGKEFDTYKVATVSNSTSTMHTIHKTPITMENFEIDDMSKDLPVINDIPTETIAQDFIELLEELRKKYLTFNTMAKEGTPELREQYARFAKKYWKELIRWTPSSWLQTRTITLNYETILSMCHQRQYHKLNEWSGQDDDSLSNFLKFAHQLPYANELLFLD